MAAKNSLMPFLRPLGLPRPSTVRHFLQSSTITQCRAISQTAQRREEDKNLVASRTASPVYPPSEMTSDPRPKISRASRRTAHPRKERDFPTRGASHQQAPVRRLNPEPVKFLATHLCAPNLKYYVSRTRNQELPVYEVNKRGGNLSLTVVKKVDGDIGVLRDEISEAFAIEKEHTTINTLTKGVMFKGHHKHAIVKFLRERKF